MEWEDYIKGSVSVFRDNIEEWLEQVSLELLDCIDIDYLSEESNVPALRILHTARTQNTMVASIYLDQTKATLIGIVEARQWRINLVQVKIKSLSNQQKWWEPAISNIFNFAE